MMINDTSIQPILSNEIQLDLFCPICPVYHSGLPCFHCPLLYSSHHIHALRLENVPKVQIRSIKTSFVMKPPNTFCIASHKKLFNLFICTLLVIKNINRKMILLPVAPIASQEISLTHNHSFFISSCTPTPLYNSKNSPPKLHRINPSHIIIKTK